MSIRKISKVVVVACGGGRGLEWKGHDWEECGMDELTSHADKLHECECHDCDQWPRDLLWEAA